jgi:hypothetical protein
LFSSISIAERAGGLDGIAGVIRCEEEEEEEEGAILDINMAQRG